MRKVWQAAKQNILLPGKAYRGDILFWSAVFSLLRLALMFSGGFFFGFKTVSVTVAACGTIGILLLMELLRAATVYLLASGKKFRLPVCVIIGAAFCAADLLLRVPLSEINAFRIIEFFAESLLLTALSYKGRFAAAFLFSLLSRGVTAILPFAPDFPGRLSAIISTVLAMMFLIVLDCAFGNNKQPRHFNHRTRMIKRISAGIGGVLLAAVVLFFAGFLPVHPVSVATGSMQPEIAVGDVLLVQNCGTESVNIGDVIQFRHNGKTVMHRVVKAETIDGNLQFITKGDANNANDIGSVGADDLVGKVVGKIPSLGKLTLWLHER